MDWLQGGIIVAILLDLVILKALLELSSQIANALENMPRILAASIPELMQNIGDGGDFERPTAIQGAIAQLIMSKVQNPQVQEILDRTPDGKFS